MFKSKNDAFLKIYNHKEIRIASDSKKCLIDGKKHSIKMGMWMFYIPKTGEKFLHVKDGFIDCIHASRPEDLTKDCSSEIYTDIEWREALTTLVDFRLAELLVAVIGYGTLV